MNAQHDLTPVVWEWLDDEFATLPEPSAIAGRVQTLVHQTPQQRGVLPRLDTARCGHIVTLAPAARG